MLLFYSFQVNMNFHLCKYEEIFKSLPASSSKIAVLVAHPDDESFGFGGLIQRYKLQGIDVITLTQGEKGDGGCVQKRTSELKKAANILGVNNLFLFNLPDGRLNTNLAKVKKVIRMILNSTYQTIATMHPEGTSHPDHRVISKLLLRNSKNKKILLQFLPEKVSFNFQKDKILEVKLSDKEYKTKKVAIQCHQSQSADINRILPKLHNAEHYFKG